MQIKQVFTTLAASALCLTSLASCGEKALYDYNFDDYLTLGNYKGVEVSRAEIKEQMDKQVDSLLTANAYDEPSGKPAEDGSKVAYSYTGTVDGKEQEKLTSGDKIVVLGAGSTGMPELNEALKGVSKGDKKDVTVKIPADMTGDPAIDGKEAVLSVTVADVTVSVTPDALTDEMVKTSTKEEYTTVDAYEEYLYSAVKQTIVWKDIMASTQFSGYPKDEAEHYYDNSLASYTQSAAQYGITLESLVSVYGMTMDAFYKNLADQAVAQVNQDMVMYAIAEKEGLEPDEAKLDEVAADMLRVYTQFKDIEELKKNIEKDALIMSAKYEMVMDYIEVNAVEVD